MIEEKIHEIGRATYLSQRRITKGRCDMVGDRHSQGEIVEIRNKYSVIKWQAEPRKYAFKRGATQMVIKED